MSRPPLPPAVLQKAAEQERARRAAASKASVESGKVTKERADYDDALWSNIVHFFRRWSGDRREPQGWSPAQCEIMARSARATYKRMLEILDGTDKPADIEQLKSLREIADALEFPFSYSMAYPLPCRCCAPRKAAAA